MNQLQMNEFGLSESLESVLAQISALANVANFTISTADASLYMSDAAQMLNTIRNLSADAERYRAEWEALIPRHR
ncbi:hypothetical protein ACTNF7_003446 [Citrobacter braakii]|nr:hypothetical protein [Citrobacter freundii]